MKTLIVSIFLILITSSMSMVEDKKNEWNLKGRVKTVITYVYSGTEKFGESQKGILEYKNIEKFDVAGNIKEVFYYGSNGDLSSTSLYIYDNNRIIEVNSYLIDGSLNGKMIYTYDEKGNNTEKTNYNSDGSLIFKFTYNYNSKKYKTEENRFDSDGKLDNKYTYKYNENGAITEAYQSDYEHVRRIQAYKDSDGRGIRTEVYQSRLSSDGSFSTKETFIYDNNGNITSRSSYSADGHIVAKEIYKYNDKGDELEDYTTVYQNDGTILLSFNNSTKYDKYDKLGNWLRKSSYKNFKIQNITEREIECY